MWAKNLLFLAVCVAGLGALWSTVLATGRPRAPALPRPDASLQITIEAIDAAFARQWSASGLRPAEPATQLAVARRISLALTGTIPSLEEIRAFEALPADIRIETFLAQRFADRRSADHLAERLARAMVGVDDGPFLLYRRRRFVSWLADQLADNRPYDQTVRHVIADSGLWTDTPATNFVTVTIRPDDDNKPNANQLAARVARAFLGVRLDCAECHDHPFDAWKQRDFERLAAFFAGTRQSLRGVRDTQQHHEVEDRATGQPRVVECGVPFAAELLAQSGTARRRLADWTTHRQNRAFARATANRAWAILFGRPLVEPIDNIPLGDDVPEALELLADDFAAHDFDLRRLLTVIAGTRAFRLDSRLAEGPGAAAPAGASDDSPAAADERARRAAAWAIFPLTRLRPEQVVGAVLQSASLSTIDYESNILIRFARAAGQNDFIARYGDAGADEFDPRGGTIPQRLLMMNGQIVFEKTKDDLLGNAASKIALLAPSDDVAIETALLATLTRRPSNDEQAYFRNRLLGSTGRDRTGRLGDLFWSLLNTTEFAWNH
jgi:hypothetical protein